MSELFETLGDAINPRQNRVKSLLSSYDFETVDEIVMYIFESYINGQKKQAKEVYNECVFCIDAEDLETGFYMACVQIGIFDFCDICSKLDLNKTLIDNSIYDNDWNSFDKFQAVSNAAYERNRKEK